MKRRSRAKTDKGAMAEALRNQAKELQEVGKEIREVAGQAKCARGSEAKRTEEELTILAEEIFDVEGRVWAVQRRLEGQE